MTLQSFDELHVISDLHLGGKKGFQIFCMGDILTDFIKRLAQPSPRRVCLVLNGDTVDFLAEATTSYLDPRGATDKLQRIFYEDAAFKGVWSVLQTFVSQPGRQLVIVLGNHDVELALPHVTEWLLENLSNNDSAARGRVTTCFDGNGFACSVGSDRVLCVHGNDLDLWNIVDHTQLRELSFCLNCGKVPSEWDPNAGTRMVIDVMNGIKVRYPIVDLLKPEREAVVPALLCLDPGRLKEITRILKVAAYLSRDAVLKTMGFLSAENILAQSPITDEEVVSQFSTRYFEYGRDRQMTAESLINEAYKSIEAETKGLPRPPEELQFLGPIDYLPAILGYGDKVEKLRKAFKKNLEQDQTFDITYEDDTFKEIDMQAGPNVNFLITGHTNLERATPRSASGCYYYNSGSWIRLIRLTDGITQNAQEFAKVYKAFESGSMEELDGINDLGPNHNQPLVMLKPTVVSIVRENGQTFGELRHAQPGGLLQPVNNSRFSGR